MPTFITLVLSLAVTLSRLGRNEEGSKLSSWYEDNNDSPDIYPSMLGFTWQSLLNNLQKVI